MARKGRSKAGYKEEKDGETQKLRDTIRRLKSDNAKLKSELRTYEAAFEKNIQFLKGKTKDLSLQELINGAKKEQSLKQIEDEKEITFERLEKRWRCHKCNDGVMKMIVFNRMNDKWYLRKCTQCDNRTEAKPHTEDVEIS